MWFSVKFGRVDLHYLAPMYTCLFYWYVVNYTHINIKKFIT